ncbi:hypothetical protein JCM16303_002040 [Sporobolomyces ruberrimus]
MRGYGPVPALHLTPTFAQVQDQALSAAQTALGTGGTYKKQFSNYLDWVQTVNVPPFPISSNLIAIAIAARVSSGVKKGTCQYMCYALKKVAKATNGLFNVQPRLPGMMTEEEAEEALAEFWHQNSTVGNLKDLETDLVRAQEERATTGLRSRTNHSTSVPEIPQASSFAELPGAPSSSLIPQKRDAAPLPSPTGSSEVAPIAKKPRSRAQPDEASAYPTTQEEIETSDTMDVETPSVATSVPHVDHQPEAVVPSTSDSPHSVPSQGQTPATSFPTTVPGAAEVPEEFPVSNVAAFLWTLDPELEALAPILYSAGFNSLEALVQLVSLRAVTVNRMCAKLLSKAEATEPRERWTALAYRFTLLKAKLAEARETEPWN